MNDKRLSVRWTGCLAAALAAVLLLTGCAQADAGPSSSGAASWVQAGTGGASAAASTSAVSTAPSSSAVIQTVPSTTAAPLSSTSAVSTTAATSASTTVVPTTTAPTLTAAAILLYDEEADTILFGREIDTPRQPASLTKLLTGITALENCPEDAVFTVEQEMLDPVMYDASKAGLEAGMELTLRQLLEALMLPSGCDAGYVIAAGVGRRLAGDDSLPALQAVELFCEVMNETAKRLGADNSHFVNPDGYPHEQHLSTARDLLAIAQAARQVPLLREIMAESRAEVTAGGKTLAWNNTNALLREDSGYYMPGVTGMKTGYARAAGYCIAVSATLGGREYIAIVLGCPSNKDKYSDVRLLFERVLAGGTR